MEFRGKIPSHGGKFPVSSQRLSAMMPAPHVRAVHHVWLTLRREIMRMLKLLCACTALGLVAPLYAVPVTIVNDSWADGGRDNGPDPLDSNWWTSSASTGIEVSVGSLGMVTGSSGRGIHTIFPTQALANIGDKLTATYTFNTPATV